MRWLVACRAIPRRRAVTSNKVAAKEIDEPVLREAVVYRSNNDEFELQI